MTSLTQMAYGSRSRRHGRARWETANQENRRRRSRRRASGEMSTSGGVLLLRYGNGLLLGRRVHVTRPPVHLIQQGGGRVRGRLRVELRLVLLLFFLLGL